MRTLKTILAVPVIAVFVIGLTTIYSEARKKFTKVSTEDMKGMQEIQVVDGTKMWTRVINLSERNQTLVQVLDGAGNQVDVTLGSGTMTTSVVVSKPDYIYYYFDRDGDGMPEIRSRKNPKSRESVFEYLETPRWLSTASKTK